MSRRDATLQVLALALLAWSGPAQAASEREAALILRAVTYLRDFEARVGEEVVIGVVYPSQDSAVGAEWVSAFSSLTNVAVAGRPLRVVGAEVEESAALVRLAQEEELDVVFFAGLYDERLDAMLRGLEGEQLLSACASALEVERGVGLGIAAVDSDVRLFVNQPAAKAVGATFDARLLALATIYR